MNAKTARGGTTSGSTPEPTNRHMKLLARAKGPSAAGKGDEVDPCKISCTDGCKPYCKDNCKSSCKADCTSNCTTSCQYTCMDACKNTVKKG